MTDHLPIKYAEYEWVTLKSNIQLLELIQIYQPNNVTVKYKICQRLYYNKRKSICGIIRMHIIITKILHCYNVIMEDLFLVHCRYDIRCLMLSTIFICRKYL